MVPTYSGFTFRDIEQTDPSQHFLMVLSLSTAYMKFQPKCLLFAIWLETLKILTVMQNCDKNCDHKRGTTSTKPLASKDRSSTIASVASTTSSQAQLWTCIFAREKHCYFGSVLVGVVPSENAVRDLSVRCHEK